MDAKGRVNVPASFREVMQERYEDSRLVLATPFDRCLRAYPLKEWEEIEAAASRMPSTDPDVKIYFRHFIGSALESECDRQGRVLLPPSHKDWAQMNGGPIVFIGLINRMEIWSRAGYDQDMEDRDFASVERAVSKYGGQI